MSRLLYLIFYVIKMRLVDERTGPQRRLGGEGRVCVGGEDTRKDKEETKDKLLASRNGGKKLLLFKPSGLWYLVTAAPAK